MQNRIGCIPEKKRWLYTQLTSAANQTTQRAAYYFIACVLLLIAGCSDSNPSGADPTEQNPPTENNGQSDGGDNDDLSPDVSTDITVMSSGTGPLRTLTASASTMRLLSLDAVRTSSFSTNDDVMLDETSANYDLRADLTANSTDVVLDMIPVLNRMEPAQQPMPTVIPGAWNRTYNLQGELLESRSTDTDGIFTFNTNGIFAVSGLMLAVPEEPVGAGADWYFDTEDNGVVLRTRVSVLDITDEQISISATTSLLSANNNQLDSFEETATGLYSTNSLLVSSMDVSRSINFTTNQNVNNEPAIITGAWQSTETIREITQ